MGNVDDMMEKTCEYCMLLKPVVYCSADAAHLCLSCDSKVHSANALSSRHPRTLVCESCRCNPAFVQCSGHRMFMCRDCDRSHHGPSSQHQKRVISSYFGCPSAKDLAALWGFDLNELDSSSTFQSQLVSTSNITVERFDESSNVTKRGSLGVSKALKTGNQQESSCLILQQILDLERLQLTEGNENSSLISGHVPRESSIKCKKALNVNKTFTQNLPRSPDLAPELQDWAADPFPSAFPQLDGDSFWQCKSPINSSLLWPQNMQDLGVCDELGCLDSFNMPDVDLTFHNIEELFGSEQELNKSLLDNDSSMDMSCNGYSKMVEDVSAASSTCKAPSGNDERANNPSTRVHSLPTVKDCPRPIRQSFSTLSFSASRFSNESSGTEYMDSGLSPFANGLELSCNSHDSESSPLDDKENISTRHKGKKKIRRYVS
ncbi:PREDICTED: putative zinc finger protein At1g68190 isoform X2 [Ipomoea nil]|uniref:putative zinc finger protein At1g68190 isoform X2 n=1 Tax=Ipomoea nil TaxID=35883 RepID=UPI0009008B13|nr:PREDICTED: putative zinc finger protein At1g68190 isoform X2 [Ipomoea nil]